MSDSSSDDDVPLSQLQAPAKPAAKPKAKKKPPPSSSSSDELGDGGGFLALGLAAGFAAGFAGAWSWDSGTSSSLDESDMVARRLLWARGGTA